MFVPAVEPENADPWTCIRYLQKPSRDELDRELAVFDGEVFLDSGVIVIGPEVSDRLLALCEDPALAVTLGLARASVTNLPIRLELYSDIMFCCHNALSEAEYMAQTQLPREFAAELKGSIGEGPNHSNHFEPFEPFEFFQNRNFPEFFLRKFKISENFNFF